MTFHCPVVICDLFHIKTYKKFRGTYAHSERDNNERRIIYIQHNIYTAYIDMWCDCVGKKPLEALWTIDLHHRIEIG